jgi:hypothetical protein
MLHSLDPQRLERFLRHQHFKEIAIMIPFNKSSATVAAACAVALGSSFAIVAHAEETSRKLVVSYIEDAVGAGPLSAGKYAEAIKQINRPAPVFYGDELAKSTNLCVALIMTRQWDTARNTCDRAVSEAVLDVPDAAFGMRAGHDALVALTYSNRAVLNFLAGRSEAAVRDATRAHKLAPHSEFVAQNWLVMNATPSSVTGPAIAAAGR